jgi:hypothetical protein
MSTAYMPGDTVIWKKDSVLLNTSRQGRRANTAVATSIKVTTINLLLHTPHVKYPLTLRNTCVLLLLEAQAGEAW